VLGDDYSVADAYLFTVAGWLPADGVDMSALPRLSAHQQRIGQRAAVQRALAAVAPT
jgi:glutathione S-transferase